MKHLSLIASCCVSLIAFGCSATTPVNNDVRRPDPTKRIITDTLFIIDSTESKHDTAIEFIPLTDWSEEKSHCDSDQVPAFNFDQLSDCIAHSMRMGNYSQTLDLFKLLPTRDQEKRLLQQKTTLNALLLKSESHTKEGEVLTNELTTDQEHYRIMSGVAKNQTEMQTMDSSEVITKWEGLIHKLNRKIFMKAQYHEITYMIDAMGGTPPTPDIAQQIDGLLKKVISRDLKNAQVILDQLKEAMNIKGDFTLARTKLDELNKKYRHIEKEYLYSKLAIAIDQKEQEFNTTTSVKNSDALLAEAKSGISQGQYLMALELLQSIQHTKHRAEVQQLMKEIGNNYCKEKRVLASQDLKESFSHRGSSTERSLLERALNHLNQCIETFPANDYRETILKNRAVLEKRLD
ncbi:MAG: hypothetical protein OCD01_05970 [Fibrobacterales bacterium]